MSQRNPVCSRPTQNRNPSPEPGRTNQPRRPDRHSLVIRHGDGERVRLWTSCHDVGLRLRLTRPTELFTVVNGPSRLGCLGGLNPYPVSIRRLEMLGITEGSGIKRIAIGLGVFIVIFWIISAALWTIVPGGERADRALVFVGILDLIVFLFVATVGLAQLIAMRGQNELSRIIFWKSSIQEINKLILENPDKFVPIFYPGKRPEEVLRITGAYTSLNTFETIFHMRKSQDPKQVKELLRTYIFNNDPIKELWKQKEYRDAFTTEFQDAINDILPKTSLNE